MRHGRIGGRILIRISERFRLVGSRSLSNKPTNEMNKIVEKKDGPLTHHDSYRDLDNLDFMTAAKILFTTPPKPKKFGIDFHVVQFFIACLPSLAVYLVAQYARHEMKKMDAELEKLRQAEEVKRIKAAEEEALKSNPQLMEVKERLESLEKTVNEIVVESKNKRSIKAPEKHEDDRKQTSSKPAFEDRPSKPAPNQNGQQGDSSRANNK